ncbi:MAG: exonuclease domain-containing protein, partial [Porticoccaceae bacterium]|nr:exonuclease domain-containing protein [Porticoccaceae bacterium]
MDQHTPVCERFRGFLPVVVDLETGGFDKDRDALLEIAAVTLTVDEDGWLLPDDTLCCASHPFEGANIDPAALEITGIDPDDPERGAVDECEALTRIFQKVRKAVKSSGCKRAVMVAHNAHFDLGFVNAAVARCDIKRNPF